MPAHRFTGKQRAFIDWYCSAAVNCNATEAARRAGYKGNQSTLGTIANENMQKPAIREEIDSRLRKATMGSKVTIEHILKELQSTYCRASREGKYSVAVRCLELQGKYLRMFTECADQTIDEISTEELVELIKEISSKGKLDLVRLLTENDSKPSRLV